MTSYTTRPATLADAPAIARIYSEGIADRIATFETEPRTSAEILEWFRPGTLIVVAGAEKGIAAFAASFPYSTRPCYAGIGEFSVYVARDQRRQGAGRVVLSALIEAARTSRPHRLTSRVFPENVPRLDRATAPHCGRGWGRAHQALLRSRLDRKDESSACWENAASWKPTGSAKPMQRVQSDSPSYLKGAVSGLAPTTQKFGLSLILTGALMIIGWGGSTWNVSRTFGDAAFVVAAFLTACFTVIMRQAKLDPITQQPLFQLGRW